MPPNPQHWGYEIGGTGFGTNELEYDTDRPENVATDGQGSLVITARQEPYMGNAYTSARLTTAGKFEQAYGRFEARMKLPIGQGLWPAFWVLGNDFSVVGWPGCGEVDIMECRGSLPATVRGTLHGPGYSDPLKVTGSYTLPDGQTFADDFHLFTLDWEPGAMRWYVDGMLYETRLPENLSGGPWVFDHPFFILVNLAVGGIFDGDPGPSTVFPQTLTIDYVRVYAH
jgi:beta-glucanase (GH16 family)